MRHGPFESEIGFVNLHPSIGTHWLAYINQIYFDSYSCSLPQKLSKFIVERTGQFWYSEYKIQGLTIKKGSNFAVSSLYIIYFTQVVGIDFKSEVLNLHYQNFSLIKWRYGN